MDDYIKEPARDPYWQSEPGVSGSAAAARMKLADKAAEVTEKVADLGRRTVDKLDGSRVTAASALDATASTLHARSDQLSGAAHSAADKIQATADYVRHTNLRGMADDAQDVVRRYPALALTTAAVFGFLAARAFRRFD